MAHMLSPATSASQTYVVHDAQVHAMFDQNLGTTVVYNTNPVPAPISNAAGPHAMLYQPGQMSNNQKKEENKAIKHANNAMHKAAQNAGPQRAPTAVLQSAGRMTTAINMNAEMIARNQDNRAANRARAWGQQQK